MIFRVAIGLFVAACMVGLYLSPLREQLTLDNIRALLDHVKSLWYGPIAFIIVYAIGVVLWVPASIFILAGGVIWGWKLGGAYALAGGILGAFVAYRIGHFVGGGLLTRFGKAGAAVAKRLDHAGFSTLLTLRLIPVFPFALLNYGAGVAGLRNGDFLLATLFGLAPANFVLAYSADALVGGTLSRQAAFERVGIAIALVAALFVVSAVIRRKARKVLEPEAE